MHLRAMSRIKVSLLGPLQCISAHTRLYSGCNQSMGSLTIAIESSRITPFIAPKGDRLEYTVSYVTLVPDINRTYSAWSKV